jgi:hypothetical protein
VKDKNELETGRHGVGIMCSACSLVSQSGSVKILTYLLFCLVQVCH